MDKKKHKFVDLYLLMILCVAVACNSKAAIQPSTQILGYVQNEAGPASNALVRVQATDNLTYTDAEGFFTLNDLDPDESVIITAWSDGHYVGWVEAVPSKQPVTIQLSKYYTTDNPDYNWFSHEGAEGSLSCSHCMPSYDEWVADAHSQSAVNPRFLTMYNGTDVEGNQSPLTRIGFSRDYGSFPLPPDTSQPYYGPGYKLDFPNTAGNCATCHVPAQAAHPGMEYSADPNFAEGIELEGIFCEFCHKIGDVTLDPQTELPYPNMPGVMSMQLFRPQEDQQLFFGNFDDVNRRVSYLPLIEESAYCASCHFGVFWDTTIYNSYGEWLESSYSDPESGQTCQQCHMPPVDYNYFVYPEQGGLIRDTGNIYSHLMPGAMDEDLLQNAVSLDALATLVMDEIRVEVSVTNDKTGHDVPTDFPLRQMILLVQASAANGQPVELLKGSTIPEYGGVGDPLQGYYAGLPGKIYMKVLQELWTQVYPSGAYWNPTIVLSDNRLSAFEIDNNTFVFAAPETGPLIIDIRLIYRRATKELMDQKVWDTPDILMESMLLTMD